MSDIFPEEVLTYERVKFLDNEHANVYYYKDKTFMHLIWKRRTVGVQYKQVFLACVEYAKENLSTYFLTDIRNQGVVGPEDRKWFETEALPAAIECGLKKSAVIFEGNIFKMHYINMVLKTGAKKGIPMKFFKELDTARKWLLNE